MSVRRLIRIAAAAVVGFGAAVIVSRATREVVGGMEALGADSGATALVVYHPGVGAFQEQVTRAFSEGLARAGWRVEMWTAHHATPADLAPYELLVLGTPSLLGAPARPVAQFAKRVSGLSGKPVVLLVTGLVRGERTTRQLETRVLRGGGRVPVELRLYTLARNDTSGAPDRDNRTAALILAREAGSALKPPQREAMEVP